MSVRNYSTAKSIVHFEGQDRFVYWRRFAMLLTLSVIIATMGLLRNSGAVVIAAMLIAPLMTPILGIAAAMVFGRIGRAIRLTGIVLVAAASASALAFVTVWIADVPRSVLLPEQVIARTDPGIEDLAVALASGIAGAYVQIQRAELSLLPGAAIGVSLVPPLSAAGMLFYLGIETGAIEALLLFATNLAAIVFSACIVYVMIGTRSPIKRGGKRIKQFTASVAVTMAVLVLIVLKLGTDTRDRYIEARTEATISRVVMRWAGDVSVEVVRVDADVKESSADLWLIIDVPLLTDQPAMTVADLIPAELGRNRLVPLLTEALSVPYDITVRFQPRFAGTLRAGSGVVEEADPITPDTHELDPDAAETLMED